MKKKKSEAQLMDLIGQYENIFKWLLGMRGEFRMRGENDGAYWWRIELREYLDFLESKFESSKRGAR